MFSVRQHEQKSLRWWYEQYRAEKLDMTPSYQRKADIWSRWKRAHLIDSIINGYDVPKFYVADLRSIRSKLNEKNRPYAIIDGKQRFGAIFEFLGDKLCLNRTSILESQKKTAIANLSYSELKKNQPNIAALIDEFRPVVMSIVSDDENRVRQLFIRLNSGESVNRAERRNAMAGPIPRMINDLVAHPFFQNRIRFNTGRMQDSNLAAKLLTIEFNEGFVDTKAPDLDRFVMDGVNASGAAQRRFEKAEERVQENLELLALAFEENDLLLSAQGNIPVYYWFLRNHPASIKTFRSFVADFSSEVKQNLQMSRLDPNDADGELMSFYTMGRTTNDKESLEGRYKIFVRRFRAQK